MFAYTQVQSSKQGHHTLWDVKWQKTERDKERVPWAVRAAEILQEQLCVQITFLLVPAGHLRGRHAKQNTEGQTEPKKRF